MSPEYKAPPPDPKRQDLVDLVSIRALLDPKVVSLILREETRAEAINLLLKGEEYGKANEDQKTLLDELQKMGGDYTDFENSEENLAHMLRDFLYLTDEE